MNSKIRSGLAQRLANSPMRATAFALIAALAAGQLADPAAKGTPSGGTNFAMGSTAGVYAVDFIAGSGSCGGNSPQSVGWKFNILEPVIVDGMCWFDEAGDGTDIFHEVGIWRPGGTLVSSTHVTVPTGTTAQLDGNWRVMDIQPTVLFPGTGYIVGGQNVTNSECLSFNVAQTVHPSLQFVAATHSGPGASFARPTTISSAENGYYGVSFRIAEDLPGEPFCYGDGSGAVCPCGNLGSAEAGCGNSTGIGAALKGNGSDDPFADDLVLVGSQLPPGVPSLFFAGDVPLNGDQGVVFGDGLRCVGGTIVRLEISIASGTGEASSSVPIAGTLGVGLGSVTYFQMWYRDPTGPCASLFNVSNAFEVHWN